MSTVYLFSVTFSDGSVERVLVYAQTKEQAVGIAAAWASSLGVESQAIGSTPLTNGA